MDTKKGTKLSFVVANFLDLHEPHEEPYAKGEIKHD